MDTRAQEKREGFLGRLCEAMAKFTMPADFSTSLTEMIELSKHSEKEDHATDEEIRRSLKACCRKKSKGQVTQEPIH